MASSPCDGCGRRVSLAGGIANLWSFEGDRTEGLTLELADDSEHFLCFDCVNALPDEPVAGDVAALPDRPADEPIGDLDAADATSPPFLLGLGAGAGIGALVGLWVGNLQWGLFTGAALGIIVVAAFARYGN